MRSEFVYHMKMTNSVTNKRLAACAHYVFTAFPYEDLGAKGFTLSPSLDRDFEGVLTQTILVQKPDGTAVRLEFREIIDEIEFMASLKKNSQGLRGRDLLRPSLIFYGSSNSILKIGSIPVQVEPVSENVLLAPSHSNSVLSLDGIYIGLTEKERAEWVTFMGAEPVDSRWVLEDGVNLYLAEPGDGLYEFMESRKDFPLWAVVLRSHSLADFNRAADTEMSLQWRGHPATLIKEHLTDWDLLVF